jgi:hypothetical protein
LLIVLYFTNAHSRPCADLRPGKVNNDGIPFVWLSNAPFSQKHGCESRKHLKTIWSLWPPENWKIFYGQLRHVQILILLTISDYIKNICFELSFLTFIPALYTKTGCSICLGVNTCYQNNHDVPISMVMHLQISGNIYIIVMICGNKTDNCPSQLMDSLLMELWSFCTTLSS